MSDPSLIGQSTSPSLLSGKALAVITILLGCVFYMAWMESRTYEEAAGPDQAVYAVIAHDLLNGRLLYADLWDHKPPGIHIAYGAAELLVGYGPPQFFLLNLVGWSISLLALYQAGKLLAGPLAGLCAAVLWAVLVVQKEWFTEPNTEVFVTAALVWGFYIVLRMSITPSWSWACAFGAAVGIASLFKPTAFAPAGLLGLGYIVGAWRQEGSPRQAMRRMLVAAGVSMALWAGCLAWFWGQGALEDFYGSVFAFNRHYSGNMLRNFLGLRRIENRCYLLAIVIPCLLVPFFPIAPLTPAQRSGWLALAGWACGCAIAVALTGHWYGHYFQLWIPIYALAGGAFLTLTLSGSSLKRGAWRLAFLATVFAPLVLERHFYSIPRPRSNNRPDARLTGLAINRELLPEESVYVFGYAGHTSGVYFASGRRPPSGVFFDFPLQSGPLAGRLEERILRDLDRDPPDLVVLSKASFSPGPTIQTLMGGKPATWGQRLADWFSRHYVQRRSSTPEKYLFYARRGSSLEARLPE